jgi:hypothetical protein
MTWVSVPVSPADVKNTRVRGREGAERERGREGGSSQMVQGMGRQEPGGLS